MKNTFVVKEKHWYLFAIEIIDTQVARRRCQHHSQPTALQKTVLQMQAVLQKAIPPKPKLEKQKIKIKINLPLLFINNRDFKFPKARIEEKVLAITFLIKLLKKFI